MRKFRQAAEPPGVHRDFSYNKEYKFLGENAKQRLFNARQIAKKAKMDENMLVYLGGQSYVLFPWLGTCSFRTLRRFLNKYSDELGISDIQGQGCSYITFKSSETFAKTFLYNIRNILDRDGLNTEQLMDPSECPVYDKYDEFIPPDLLRRAYAKDRLMKDELFLRFE